MTSEQGLMIAVFSMFTFLVTTIMLTFIILIFCDVGNILRTVTGKTKVEEMEEDKSCFE